MSSGTTALACAAMFVVTTALACSSSEGSRSAQGGGGVGGDTWGAGGSGGSPSSAAGPGASGGGDCNGNQTVDYECVCTCAGKQVIYGGEWCGPNRNGEPCDGAGGSGGSGGHPVNEDCYNHVYCDAL